MSGDGCTLRLVEDTSFKLGLRRTLLGKYLSSSQHLGSGNYGDVYQFDTFENISSPVALKFSLINQQDMFVRPLIQSYSLFLDYLGGRTFKITDTLDSCKLSLSDSELAKLQIAVTSSQLMSKINFLGIKHVPKIYDTRYFGLDGHLFFVNIMEFIEGKTLSEFIQEDKLPSFYKFKILDDLVDFLEEFHHFGFVHGDLKPTNILTNLEQTTVIDFDTVKSSHLENSIDTNFKGTSHFLHYLSQKPKISFFTPNYMSPEHLDSSKLVPESDWFSYGIIASYFLTSSSSLINQDPLIRDFSCVRDSIIYSLKNKGYSEDLAEGVGSLLYKDPALRQILPLKEVLKTLLHKEDNFFEEIDDKQIISSYPHYQFLTTDLFLS